METKNKIIDGELLTEFEKVVLFSIKFGVVLFGLFIFMSIILYDMSKGAQQFKKPVNQLILLSFVQNPRALLKISEIEEAEGHIDRAIRETELAIGLLEMHGADKQVIVFYSERLNMLKETLNKPSK
ncbi:MAG: hypothetical protein Q7S46_09000 [Gallionella sp.]|nr:hypothetical protein [Gallionella sp.]